MTYNLTNELIILKLQAKAFQPKPATVMESLKSVIQLLNTTGQQVSSTEIREDIHKYPADFLRCE